MITYELKSLEDVLRKIGKQAAKDVNWIRPKLPVITTVEYIFYWLSNQVYYRDDPPDTELIQSPRSLFENNYYGEPGTGDCDCFTTLSICALVAANVEIDRIAIVLTGRTKTDPVHIYLQVDGIPFDLTNSFFGYERKYPYSQVIPLSKVWPK